MKIVGLITEYNPFHNGHKLHINKAKKLTQTENIIISKNHWKSQAPMQPLS